MTDPWEPDRPLTRDGAAALIGESLPSIDSSDLEFLGSGWEFDAYLTRDGWVVRFPRRAEAANLFDPERQVHQLVARFLPPDIRVPQVQHVGEPALGFPYHFAAHRFIPGVPADEVDSRFVPALATQIGAALGAIHTIPEAAAREAGLVGSDVDEEGRREWFEQPLEALRAQSKVDRVVDSAAQWVKQAIGRIDQLEGPKRLIHQDLSPEHLLVDPAMGQVTGILDWTDAMLGDAARDFVFLVAWRGWSFAEDVLRNYPHEVDAGFRDRLRFMARLLTPVWLGLAHQRGTEVEKLTTWVHNAYEEQ